MYVSDDDHTGQQEKHDYILPYICQLIIADNFNDDKTH